MPIEKYILRILEDTGLSKKEIWEMINVKKKELKGLISDKAAIFMLARELCIDMSDSIETSFTELTKFLDNDNASKTSRDSTDLRNEESTILEKIISKLKNRHSDNLIAHEFSA